MQPGRIIPLSHDSTKAADTAAQQLRVKLKADMRHEIRKRGSLIRVKGQR